MKEAEAGGWMGVREAAAPYGAGATRYTVHGTRGEGPWAVGVAVLTCPASCLSQRSLPACRTRLDLLTSACWRLAPACGWRAAPSLPAAPTHRGRESCGQSGASPAGGRSGDHAGSSEASSGTAEEAKAPGPGLLE